MKIKLFTILIFTLSFIGCTNEDDIIKDNSNNKQSIETIFESNNYESLNNFENSFKIEKTISKEEFEKIKLIQKKTFAKLYDIE
jgi:hypothetical protein